MSFAQFRDLPPLHDIHEFFMMATGSKFQPEVTWSSWQHVDVDDILCFQPYIRPSHQKIILETAAGERNPCALLRQLIRPYGFCIETHRTFWVLKEMKMDVAPVTKKAGTTVDWQ
jgi:hypothetical protein